MATYKTSYIHIPFVCRWQCVHCIKENIGTGTLPVAGDQVRYYQGLFHNEKRERAATEKSLRGAEERLATTCTNFLNDVNTKKKIHNALTCVEPLCTCCGKRQPWQTRNLTRYIGIFSIIGLFICFLAMYFFSEIFYSETAYLFIIFIGGIMGWSLILLPFINPIQRLIANKKMKKYQNTPYFPEVISIGVLENKSKKN